MFFKGMKELSVSDHLDHLQQQWQRKGVCLQEEFFNNLKTLKLSCCEFEPYAIPSNVLSSFKNLTELEVAQCDKITGIFEMNDTEMKETSFQLKKLTLKLLSNATHVWQPKKQGIIRFKNLQTMTVLDCKDLSTLFPIALARDLKKLEELHVESCDALPNIVKADKAGTFDEQLVFPCLTRLILSCLTNLTDFCSHDFILEFTELSCLNVSNCNKQLELFQSQREENQNSTSATEIFVKRKQCLFQ
ncbi:hypothetical protein PIB30_015690 [Stylosanthes scabra]|uniref:Disease resistance protein At4g27190-like leucine-rich repeats domain-containing protein n=1 Tax=Stylosanthes scabra TaxID=79078 RepID=A0ABU6U643_9FABA|nr:hypothetical protein [Stylosanthes scabra]